jgi:hypothetical protein
MLPHFASRVRPSKNRNLNELRRLRNSLGGHVSLDAVQQAIATKDITERGKFEVGQKNRDTHYGFAQTICAQILLQDVPAADRETDLTKIGALNNETMHIISVILTAFLDHKRYFD